MNDYVLNLILTEVYTVQILYCHSQLKYAFPENAPEKVRVTVLSFIYCMSPYTTSSAESTTTTAGRFPKLCDTVQDAAGVDCVCTQFLSPPPFRPLMSRLFWAGCLAMVVLLYPVCLMDTLMLSWLFTVMLLTYVLVNLKDSVHPSYNNSTLRALQVININTTINTCHRSS